MSKHRPRAAAAAARYVAAGLSYREAAEKAGVALSTCQAACARLGIKSARPVGAPRKAEPSRIT